MNRYSIVLRDSNGTVYHLADFNPDKSQEDHEINIKFKFADGVFRVLESENKHSSNRTNYSLETVQTFKLK